VADQQALFGEMLSQPSGLLHGVDVVARTCDGIHLIELVKELHPDLIILDGQLPRGDGLDMVRTLRRHSPGIKLLILTAPQSAEHLFESVRAGVDGYLPKATASLEELNRALETVARGDSYISPISLQTAVRNRGRWPPANANRLSTREREILRRLARGLSTKDIAKESGISHKTVRNHISNMYQKVGVPTRAALALYAVRHGLADQASSPTAP
jgi:two-component system NarL family response regulator